MTRQEIDAWDCSSLNPAADAPTLYTSTEPLIIKEKEIVRRSYVMKAGYSTGREAVEKDGVVSIPMPSWSQDNDSDYYGHLCVSFALSTPSAAYTEKAVPLHTGFASKKDYDYYGDAYFPLTPISLLREHGTIFGR
jgi:hypothetical protein